MQEQQTGVRRGVVVGGTLCTVPSSNVCTSITRGFSMILAVFVPAKQKLPYALDYITAVVLVSVRLVTPQHSTIQKYTQACP